MSDIVERLKANHCPPNAGCNALPRCACADMTEAADRIEALEAALEDCAAYFDDRSDVVWEGDAANEEMRLLTMVQTALGEK